MYLQEFLSIDKLGLVLNLIGTLLIALSIGKRTNGGYTEDDKGKQVHFAYVNYPVLFQVGLLIIILGFFVQLICS